MGGNVQQVGQQYCQCQVSRDTAGSAGPRSFAWPGLCLGFLGANVRCGASHLALSCNTRDLFALLRCMTAAVVGTLTRHWMAGGVTPGFKIPCLQAMLS